VTVVFSTCAVSPAGVLGAVVSAGTAVQGSVASAVTVPLRTVEVPAVSR
jgi:hypothetical protein